MSLGTALAALGALVALLVPPARAYAEDRRNADDISRGVVVEDGIGDEDDIIVRWTDVRGVVHRERFSVYDTERYARGNPFSVAYDSTRRDPAGFPLDPEETVANDDRWVPLFLVALLVGVLAVAWTGRALLHLLARSRPSARLRVSAHHGVDEEFPWDVSGGSCWLEVVPGDPASAARWQRVMWSPGLVGLAEDPSATVYGQVHRSRRVVVETDGGVRFVPIGRLRRRPRRRFAMIPWSDAAPDASQLVIAPPALSDLDSSRRTRVLVSLCCGALGGGVTMVVAGFGSAWLAGSAVGAAAYVQMWALGGGAP